MACTGALGAPVGRTGPWRALDLKPLYLRREEAGEEPTLLVTQIQQRRRPEL
jgi:hypothetical protein